MSLSENKSANKSVRPAGAPLATRLAAVAAACALALTVAACGTTPSGDPAGTAGTDARQEQQAGLAVTVTIDGSAADVEATTAEVSVPEGSTVYDALVATEADVNASDSEYGMYVMGINGLAAGDFGDMSGWLFTVNGEMAEVGCSQYELADGDVVVWTYTTDFTQE